MSADTSSDDGLIGPVARAYIRAIQARQPPPTGTHHGSTRRSRMAGPPTLHKSPSPGTCRTGKKSEEQTHREAPHRAHLVPSPRSPPSPRRTPQRRVVSVSPVSSPSPSTAHSVPRLCWQDPPRGWSPVEAGRVRSAAHWLSSPPPPPFPRAWDAEHEDERRGDDSDEYAEADGLEHAWTRSTDVHHRRGSHSPITMTAAPTVQAQTWSDRGHPHSNREDEAATLARYVLLCRYARARLVEMDELGATDW